MLQSVVEGFRRHGPIRLLVTFAGKLEGYLDSDVDGWNRLPEQGCWAFPFQ